MRLLVISDVHLEFGPFAFPKPMPEFDVAVFADDMYHPIVAALNWMSSSEAPSASASRCCVIWCGLRFM